ncbi:hypothetical protein HFP15_08715 [Amycolatopsis sp. K13G38]|uniref:Uncharacterized protein n=1 Tax=Amycolatopsis acididurans TaxID=2724524 RepID=A0ABX1J3N2_9PSEU|nr:hypothetical protein [Amycolatopsis acididurans]NKQ52960.1 hypothetical protein [Amycolatopsis acididurans]
MPGHKHDLAAGVAHADLGRLLERDDRLDAVRRDAQVGGELDALRAEQSMNAATGPAARTATRTSPGAGSGTGTSAM